MEQANIPSTEGAQNSARAVHAGRKGIVENFLWLFVIFGVLFVVFRYFGIEEMRAYIESAGVWAPLFLVLAKAGTIVFAPLSGSPLYPLAGALFGFSEGFMLIALGDALGGTISFYISRLFGRRVVERLIKTDTSVVAKALALAGTVKGFLVARIFFAALPEVASYAAGLTRLRFLPFIIIFVGVGLIPTGLLTYFGSVLAILESGPALMGIVIVGGMFSVAGLYLFSRWAKKV